jgi:guanine deaminase
MMTEQPNPYMARAIQLSIENVTSGRGGPFAALVVKDGEVIGEGTNLVTSVNDPTAHAEIVAIRRACRVLGTFQLAGCEIYSSCEPCPMCLGAIYWARPERVFYANSTEDAMAAGFDDARILEELKLPPSRRRIPMIHIMQAEALAAFQAWQAKPDKILY